MLFFLSLILWTFAAIWIGIDVWRDRVAVKNEERRVREVLAIRRRYVAINQNDPSALEMLGDALRSSGYAADALESYESALSLSGANRTTLSSGIEGKVRLTKSEIAQDKNPGEYGVTMATREVICPKCSRLNLPIAEICTTCGAPLPVNSLLETLTQSGHKSELERETLSLVGKIGIVVFAILCTSFLPWEVRGTVAIAAVIVVPIAWLRRIG